MQSIGIAYIRQQVFEEAIRSVLAATMASYQDFSAGEISHSISDEIWIFAQNLTDF